MHSVNPKSSIVHIPFGVIGRAGAGLTLIFPGPFSIVADFCRQQGNRVPPNPMGDGIGAEQ